MINDENYLSGVAISSLANQNRLTDDDLLVVSEPLNNNIKTNQYLSRKLNAKDFLSKAKQDSGVVFKFGSMAVHSEDDYSEKDHTHPQYNYTKYDEIVGVTGSYGNEKICIGGIRIDDKTSWLYIDDPTPPKPEPEIGQIKFVAYVPNGGVNVYSQDFDGWVQMDGTVYPLSDFEEVSDQFERIDDQYFVVPFLSNFIKMNNSPQNGNDYSEEYNSIVPRHNHTFNTSIHGKVKGKFFHNGGEKGDGTTSHGAVKELMKKTFTFNIIMKSGKALDDPQITYNETSDDNESFPSYYTIPLMIYIGKRKN